jgi:aminoglycoside/choline kinase family phosphotransferase
MDDRADRISAFLSSAGWGAATRTALAGDASNRRYERLTNRDGETAVLMDAPPERGEDVRPFVSVAAHLGSAGFSAPQILADDVESGLLLIEDLGDSLYARLLQDDGTDEALLYKSAVDVLAALHTLPVPEDTPVYGPKELVRTAGLAYDWYVGGIRGRVSLSEKVGFSQVLGGLLSEHAEETGVLVLRDYHAENLIWLPERSGLARVGLLDFQDAAAGHPAYDLVSLLKDARREVDEDLERDMLARFLALSGMDASAFRLAYALLGAQRNLRILGVFARLSLRDGKPQYVDFIPRVWRHLMASLEHPALAPLAARVAHDLPPPDPQHLNTLKEKCARSPTP